jgi:homoserine O-acetyltransferase
MDLFDTADHGGSVTSAFQHLHVDRVLVIGVQSDFLFPAHQQEELVNAFNKRNIPTEYVLLPSIQGHDSFLVDMDRFRPVIADFF